MKAETLIPDHPAWELEAHYLSLALRTFICTLSLQRIVLGGGVMQQTYLMLLVHRKTLATLNNYFQTPAILENIETYIVSSALRDRAGVLGAIALAQMASG